uniref:Bro-N domain-containing protein n=1 Tax=viral metagenome TaxID=1070528 RepID=A0A6C0E079_9ZZZZ
MSRKYSDVFFMDFFNDIIKVNDSEVMVVYDVDGNIWLKLKDILLVLEYSKTLRQPSNIKINRKNVKKYNNIKVSPSIGIPFNMQKNTTFINESGLYELLSISTKPIAKIFMKKYFEDIMPKIRKTGKYILDKIAKKELDKINEKLKSIKKSNKKLVINQKNIVYPEGSHIYIIKQRNNNRTYYKLGHTKNLNVRIKTYNTGNADKIYFNYIIKINNDKIDKCIKLIMKNEEYIKNKEFYKTTFNSALKFIKKCSSNINNISCGYCLKRYKFDTIKEHKCKYL